MKVLFYFQVILSVVILSEIVMGRITKEQRKDVYDSSVVASILTYWAKSPRTKKQLKEEEDNINGNIKGKLPD